MNFKILTSGFLNDYTKAVKESPLDKIARIKKGEIHVDYFEFNKSISSVYSSKIEGENIEPCHLGYLKNNSITGISTLGLFTGKSRLISFSPISCLCPCP